MYISKQDKNETIIFKAPCEFWSNYKFHAPIHFTDAQRSEYFGQCIDFIRIPNDFKGKLTAKKYDKIMQQRAINI